MEVRIIRKGNIVRCPLNGVPSFGYPIYALYCSVSTLSLHCIYWVLYQCKTLASTILKVSSNSF